MRPASPVHAALLALAASLPATHSEPAHGAEAERPGAVLLELFTSQGCSSCPAADRLLSRIGEAGSLGGVEVIPLAYHVDYWDRLGWEDPFASAEWSRRQRRYGNTFEPYSVYTPQVVVGGREHAVGSDEDRLAALVRSIASGASPARVGLRVTGPSAARLRVTVAPAVGGAAIGRDVVVAVALYENGLETRVGAGENARRTLREDYVVRRLVELPPGELEVELVLEPEWIRDRLGVAAFLQRSSDLAVLAAERIEL